MSKYVDTMENIAITAVTAILVFVAIGILAIIWFKVIPWG